MIPRHCLLAGALLVVGCGGGDSPPPGNINPYANNPPPSGSSAPPVHTPRPSTGRPSTGARPMASGTASPSNPDAVTLPETSFAAEMAVPLSFLEYARFARKSSEMLAELSKIHVAVSEAGKADKYQDRWGDLTAQHSKLIREVVETAYPPLETARELKQNYLPRLQSELQYAQAVMEEFNDLEGGLAQPYAEAKRIFEHLTKNLPAAELAGLSSTASTDSAIESPAADSGGSASPFMPAQGGAETAGTSESISPFQPANPFQPASTGGDTTTADTSVSPSRDVNDLQVDRSATGPWRVTVDAHESISLPEDARLGMKVPGPIGGGEAGVLYPLTPSPFVLLGTNISAGQSSEVWDLTSRKKVDTIEGLSLGSSGRLALRADGKYFAAQPYHESLIGIWDIDAEETLGTLPIEEWAGVEFIGFGVGNRLVCVDRDDLVIAVLPDIREERRVKLPSWRSEASYALSPGGRYLTFHADDAVRIYDLTIGQEVGTLPIDKSVRGIAYSADGMELAALYDDHFNESGIAIWDVRTGRQQSEIVFDKGLKDLVEPNPNYRGQQLDWFPDGQMLLMAGCALVDRQSGALLLILPSKVRFPLQPIGPRQIGVVRGGEYDAYTITDEQIAKTQAVADAGGKAIDAGLPTLSVAERTNLQSVIVLKGTDVPWSVSPERLGGGSVETKAQSSISIPAGQVYNGALSSRAAARLALMYSGVPIRTRTSSGWGLAPTRTPVRIDLYDTRRGRKLTSYELPFTTTLESLSPNGTLAVTRIADGLDRLDVWNLDEKEHICAWRPYTHLGEDSRDRDIQAAAFVDDGHILTMNNNSIALWEIPACRAVYEISLEGVGRPVVSPSRRFFALLDGPSRACQIFDALTGQQVGAVNCGRQPSGCGFHPSGNRLAILIGNQTGGEVLIVDMQTGEALDQFPVPRSGSLVQWMGDDHLLVGGERRFRQNTYLISLPKQMVVWNYALPFGIPLWDSSDGRHWYLSARDRSARSFAVNGVTLPEGSVADYLDDNAETPELILEPGGAIDVLVNVQDPPGESDFADRARRNIIGRYRDAGINVLEGHSLVLSITGSSGSTGNTMKFGSLTGGGGSTVSVAEQEVRWDITVSQNGETIWENRLSYSNAGSIVWMNEGTDVSSEAGNQMWKNAAAGLLNYEPPVYVFPADARDGLGGSVLTPQGPVTKFRPTDR